MSKLANRSAIKNLTTLNVDCQYLYQIGLQLFNDNKDNPEASKELNINFKTICDDVTAELEEVKKLIAVN